jgi:hypothetical protein
MWAPSPLSPPLAHLVQVLVLAQLANEAVEVRLSVLAGGKSLVADLHGLCRGCLCCRGFSRLGCALSFRLLRLGCWLAITAACRLLLLLSIQLALLAGIHLHLCLRLLLLWLGLLGAGHAGGRWPALLGRV